MWGCYLQGKDGAMRHQGWYRVTSTVRGMLCWMISCYFIYLLIHQIRWSNQFISCCGHKICRYLVYFFLVSMSPCPTLSTVTVTARGAILSRNGSDRRCWRVPQRRCYFAWCSYCATWHHPPRNMTFNQELVQTSISVDLLRDYYQALARVRQVEVRWDTLHLTVVSLLFRMVAFTCIHISHVSDRAGHL